MYKHRRGVASRHEHTLPVTVAAAGAALAAVGAGLGALVALGLGQPSRKATALPRSHSRDLERAA